MGIIHLAKRANQIRKTNGYRELLRRSILRLPVFTHLCLILSKRRLKSHILEENGLHDIIDTIGTHDHPGKYQGFGPFHSLKAMQHKQELVEVAMQTSKISPSTVMEIGTGNGGTLYVWCRYFSDIQTIISIDISHRGMTPLFKFFVDSSTDMHLIQGDVHTKKIENKVDSLLAENQLDFLYIDGDHSYEGVKEDFNKFGRFVRDGGIIGFHDINNPKWGVRKLWAELRQKHDTLEVGGTKRSGLLIVEKEEW